MRTHALLLAALLAGCGRSPDVFSCSADEECIDGVRSGTCEAAGFCSFPDTTCPGHKRYGDYADDEFAGACVDPPEPPPDCAEPCGACQVCDAGTCVLADAGAACTLPCAEFVSGLKTVDMVRQCLAFAPGDGAGTCDAAGACTLSADACAGEGAVIAACDEPCALKEHNCDPRAPASAVTPATLCETGVETGGCHSTCMNVAMQPSVYTAQQCDADGRCVADPATDCGLYTCAGQDCRTSCTKQAECAPMANCDMMTNTCM